MGCELYHVLFVQVLGKSTILSDEQIDQLVNEEMARSLNAYQQLLDTIEHKRRR
ncbi:hypothetical protein H6G76_24380 [Nostoc sp. FACHB-152]|uniref:hypothetical protein n=1 Tax=Nostoc sp. FACHB-152 TaxID=2692837 RepID=UPI001682EE9E|nr:hypothetical protein [Nostoc sp. FACHB-152]MBD2450242.1 hypothetical protein [Nostoc sp. FACHB-152]